MRSRADSVSFSKSGALAGIVAGGCLKLIVKWLQDKTFRGNRLHEKPENTCENRTS